MIKRVIQFGSATVLSLGFLGGAAFAVPTITNTGHKSVNVVVAADVNACKNVSKNNTAIGNANVQGAKTGSATVKNNTKASGDATSGPAANGNTTVVGVTDTNKPSTCPTGTAAAQDGSIDTTGGHSVNVVANLNLNLQKTVNVNNVFVGNLNVQGASSGSATVSGNTNGGGATSGNAGNTNSTTVTIVSSN